MEPSLPEERLDRAFDLLADAERRHLCRRLLARDGDVVDVEELVHAALLHRADGPDRAGEPPGADGSGRRESPAREGRTDRERARIRLVHRHLPKLADAGVVEFEPDEDVVRLCDSPTVGLLRAIAEDDGLEGVLEHEPEPERGD